MKLDLNQYVPGLLLWLSNKVASSAAHVYRARFGIGVTEWRLLSYFEIYPGTTAASACELMGLDKAAVSRCLSTLESSGWLKAKPVGLRKVKYALTASGRRLHNKIITIALTREDALLAGVSELERQTLVRLLHKMLGNLEQVKRVGWEDGS